MPHRDPTIARLGMLLHQLMAGINQRTSGETLELLHNESLTMPQMVTLHHLAWLGPQPQSELGEALRLSSSATSSLVDRMVERGLVARWEHPEDRRQRVVGIAEGGQRLVERMAGARTQELEDAFRHVDPELRARLADIFEEVIAQLRAGGGQ